jgi:hypothetical protein
VRSWRRTAERRRKLPRCVSCSKAIPRSEPDVVLERLDTGRRVFYHERCSMLAYMIVTLDAPHAWRITHRHVDAEAT